MYVIIHNFYYNQVIGFETYMSMHGILAIIIMHDIHTHFYACTFEILQFPAAKWIVDVGQ